MFIELADGCLGEGSEVSVGIHHEEISACLRGKLAQ